VARPLVIRVRGWAASLLGTAAASRPEHVPIDFRSCPNYGPTPAVSACLSPKVTGTAGYDAKPTFALELDHYLILNIVDWQLSLAPKFDHNIS
jgi:hypothetical protein